MNAAMDLVYADQRQISSRGNFCDVQIEPASVTTSASAFIPTWASTTVKRLNELLHLKDNWDSYGASKPSATSAVELIKVLCSVATPDTPAPAIIPSPFGHFQAEWHQNGVDLEVEVMSPTKIHVSFSDVWGITWQDELSLDMTRLTHAVRRIGRAP